MSRKPILHPVYYAFQQILHIDLLFLLTNYYSGMYIMFYIFNF
jgi:hypothetical protein